LTDEDIKPFNTDEGLWFLNDDGEFVQATAELPSEMESMLIAMSTHVHFYLYTRKDINNSEAISIGDVETLSKTNFNASRETKLVTHGWLNGKNSKSCQLAKEGNHCRGMS
jgi:hypothetical protein